MKSTTPRQPYVLGLDIGVASIGWTMFAKHADGDLNGVYLIGAHVFDAGVEGDVESGRDEARGAARREARLPRRTIERRQRRRKRILHLLQRTKLLPPGDTRTPQAIHDYLLNIDEELRKRHASAGARTASHVLPYRLRAAALDRKLAPDELGRAFYHLAQRRGFLSNRKSVKKEEDEGAVKTGITELQVAMDSAGARTLGAYFSGLDPEVQRIRRRWTARAMYVDEFNRIYDTQAGHYPEVLTREFREELHRAIFFQRPLKSQRHLIGGCELVPTARRAALADRVAQRFRILQKVNDLRVRPPDGSERCLAPVERTTLFCALLQHGDMTFAQIKHRKVLGLPKGTTFNLEQDNDEKKLPGHRTDEKLRAVFGTRWDDLTEQDRDDIVLEMLSFQNVDALARRAAKAWSLDDESAKALADTRLELGYAAHSRKALRQLVDAMLDGTPYATARRRLFPGSFESTDPHDCLPPIRKALPSLRNPAVERALTELRKLVNEIIRVHGKPQQIRIELARDLKRSRKQREAKSKEIDDQTKLRERAKDKYCDELNITDTDARKNAKESLRRSAVEKILLAEECSWTCPYTGRPISMRSLLGDHGQFDVEHILPLSRSLDNSFVNKTLCFHEENRERKRNRTPHEAYRGDSERYQEILSRVRRFQGRAAREKLRRFELEAIPEDFVSRQLNDTRYASRLAGDYLAALYGGRSDASGTQRIQISAGGITAYLRNEWDLNSILGDGGQKTREDHRHHAVDAVVVALASPKIVQELQRAAERASAERRRLFAQIPEPWPGFLNEVRERVLAVNVSSRVTKRVAGGLHDSTNYSTPHRHVGDDGKPKMVRHVRKALVAMSSLEVDEIVDPIVRRKVQAQLAQKGGDPKKVFADIQSLPVIRTRDGRDVQVKKARIRKVVSAVTVGQGARARNVAPSSNHHAVIVARLDEQGNETRWDDHPVTRLQAYERVKLKQPVVQRDWGEGRRFKFSLSANEYVVFRDAIGTERLCRLLNVSKGEYEFRLHTDARMASEARRKGSGARIRMNPERMRKCLARKVRVTYLGEIVPAND